ncbi:MAG: hypothetical protein IKR42_07060, partial [Campylobacter sp.]|nr:hypothetical protein [Campylobacter sp.]
MILIHTALLCEAMPIIERFKLKLDKSEKFKIYKNEQIWLCVLGVGAKNTANLAEILRINYFRKVVNLGICGCSDKGVKIGEIFCINEKIEGFKTANLECVSSPKTAINATLCDMESDEFKRVCKEFKLPFLLVKIVSDYLQTEQISKNFVYNLVKNQIKNIE